jgi:hypothetical protein
MLPLSSLTYHRCKDLLARRSVGPPPIFRRFRPEFEGLVEYQRSSLSVRSRRFHGSVVRELEAILSSAGFDTWNKKPIDLLAALRQGSRGAIFEVKTNSSWDSVYKAVGQLLINSQFVTVHGPRVGVFPDTLSKVQRGAIAAAGIVVLLYKRSGPMGLVFANDPAALAVTGALRG